MWNLRAMYFEFRKEWRKLVIGRRYRRWAFRLMPVLTFGAGNLQQMFWSIMYRSPVRVTTEADIPHRLRHRGTTFRRPFKGWQLLTNSSDEAKTMRTVVVALLLAFSTAFAADADRVIGVWKLISWQVIVGNEPPRNEFGEHPKGFLILTREGRSIVVTTAENRRAGMNDAERAALHKSMLAYSGRYRIEGNDFVTAVDVSWNESWNGTEQRRHFRIDGDRLFIESAPAPSILFPGKTDFRRIVWERENST